MTLPRRELVDPSVTRWYHCISKCVRSAFLMSAEKGNRKQWVEDRIKLLTDSFSVSVGGFAILDNHLHVLCRLDPETAKHWSGEEVVRRWISVYPPKTLNFNDKSVVDHWVKQYSSDAKKVERLRERLADLGWFMKSLKEPLARMANKADGCRGTFWEARYKSIAILDNEALLSTCAYIDLNIVAAGMADTPESSRHTSIKQRVEHVRSKGEIAKLRAAVEGSVAGSKAAGDIEQGLWLVPVEDRRSQSPGSREGMLETFSLGSYLLLLDYTGRLVRHGKARINATVKDVFSRLKTNSEMWHQRIGKMLASGNNLRGTFFATGANTIRVIVREKERRFNNLSPQVG
jgi:REP element-mobilizing transposase RayT